MRKPLTVCALLLFPLVSWAQSDTLVHRLADVVVTGTQVASDLRHLPMSVTVVDHETLTENERPSLLPTLEEQVPGLFVTARALMGYGVSDGSSGSITLRGMNSTTGQLLILIDGHPQYQGLFGHSVADNYLTLLTERVEVLSGPASTLYGSNAMGGVLNIVTRQMNQDGTKTDLSFGAGSYKTIQAEATNRSRKGRFYSVAGLQYGRSDNHRPDMDFYQYSGMAKLGVEVSSHWDVHADFDITHFAASYPGSLQSPLLDARQWVNRGTAQAVIENHYARTSGALSAYYNFGRHKVNDGHAADAEPKTYLFRSRDALAGFSVYQSATLFQGNRLTAGVDYQHIYGWAGNRDMATGEITRTMGNEGNEREDEVAAYIDLSQDLWQLLTLDAGIRLDHHTQTGTEWVPQGGVALRLTEGGALKAIVSKGFRNPSLKEMYLWGMANDELRPERVVSYELSWHHRLSNYSFSYGANVFLLKGDNIIQTVTNPETGRPLNVNSGAVENSGVELEADWRINSHWRVNGNYSYLHMKNKLVASPTHKFYAGAHYTVRSLSIAAGLQYVGKLYTQVGEQETTQHFWLLNATASYRVCRYLSLWLKGDNLLAQRYEINYGYPMPRATVMAGIRVNL